MVLGILIEAWLANENHFVKFSTTRHRLEKIFDNVLSRDISVQKKSMHVIHIDGVLLPFQISKQLPLRMHHFAFHLKFLLSLNEFTTLIFPQILCKIHFNSVFVVSHLLLHVAIIPRKSYIKHQLNCCIVQMLTDSSDIKSSLLSRKHICGQVLILSLTPNGPIII